MKNYLVKLTAVIFCLFSVLSLGAQNQKVTVSVKDAPLKEVLNSLQSQSGFSFVYSSSEVNVNEKVTLNLNNVTLDEAMKNISASRFSYKFSGKQILLSPLSKGVSSVRAASGRRVISGTITDETGETVIGASVFFKGTTNGVATDIDGKYSIEASGNYNTLVVSCIGFEEVELQLLPNQDVYNVALKMQANLMDEIVVTGYQTISKERATGSFSVITPKNIESKLQTNVIDRLEGQVAGLNFNRNSVSIRGVSTLEGETSPLYVVDGVPYEGSLDAINPSDIVNITVLKDATAASIYGARSANGVIVITTRSGQQGPTRVNYSGTVKFQGLPDREYSNRMNSAELVDYQQLLMEVYPNVSYKGEREFQNPVQLLLMQNRDGIIDDATLEKELEYYRTHDRYEQVLDELRPVTLTHQHNLSFSGGSEIYKYSISANYLGNAPYEKGYYDQRIGFNFKNTFDFFKWLRVDAGILASQTSADNYTGFTAMSYLNAGVASYYMLRDDEGNPMQMYQNKSQYEIDRLKDLGLQDETFIPLNQKETQRTTSKSTYWNINLGATFKIIEGLNLSLRYQTELTNSFNKVYSDKNNITVRTMINDATQINDQGIATYNVPQGGQVRKTYTNGNSWTARAQADYTKSFGSDHDFQALAGFEMRKVTSLSDGYWLLGYDDDNLGYSKYDALTMSKMLSGTESLYGTFSFSDQTPSVSSSDDRYISMYANASYTWKKRLTVTGSIRIDQSNLFGTDPKYQYRPLWSLGAHYVLLKDKSFVDRLVLRATYGINGNVPKLNGPYLIALVGRNNYYTNENTMYIKYPPNPQLRWEKTNVFNVAVDFDLFKGRLGGSLEFYNKNTTDLLGDFSLDPTLGWAETTINFGSMYNRGVELSLNSVNINKNGFKWTSNFIFSYNKNMITKVEESDQSAYSYFYNLNTRKGYPMNAMFSVRFAGLDENGNPTAYQTVIVDEETGEKEDVIIQDYRLLTKDDLVYSGTYTPPYNASFTNTLSYKGIELSFMFIYQGGHVMRDIRAGQLIINHPIYAVTNTDRDMANFWRPGMEITEDVNPAFMFQNPTRTGSEYLWRAADYHIQRGDFIKLRDVTLSYNLPASILKNTKIQGVRLNFQARNLWWWAANKSKLDPEIWSGSSMSPSRGTLYPAEFTFGLNLSF